MPSAEIGPTSWPRPSADERSNSRYRSGRSAPAAGASTACRTGPDCDCARTESHGDRVALDLDALRHALRAAMADVSAGRVSMPPRIAAMVPDRGLVAAMPAHLQGSGGLAAKLVSLFPANAGTRLPTHQAVVIVFDADCGEPQALLDGTSITTLRTAGGSALSAELLAREDAATLAILGTGVQARAHAEAMVRVRRIQLIRVAGRTRTRWRPCARRCRTHSESLPLEPIATRMRAPTRT